MPCQIYNGRNFTNITKSHLCMPNLCKMLPTKVPGVRDIDKSSDLAIPGYNSNSCKTLISNTNAVCPRHSSSGLGVKLTEVHSGRNKNALHMKENRTVSHKNAHASSFC